MKPVDIHEAKTGLSKLVERAEAGDEIVIARAGRPVAKLVALTMSPAPRRYWIYVIFALCGNATALRPASLRAWDTTLTEPTLNLSDQLAQEARAAGLLTPEELERMVREVLRNRRTQQLEQARDVLAANPMPPMTAEESGGDRRLSRGIAPCDWFLTPMRRSQACSGEVLPAS